MKKQKKIMVIAFLIIIILNICVVAVVTEKKNVLFGDADQNNIVDKKDAEIILNKIAEEKANQASSITIPVIADTNLDDRIDLLDVVDVARYDKAKKETNNVEWITKLEKDIEFRVTQSIIIDLSNKETGKVEVEGKNYGKITYKSENNSIAAVDENGNVTAKTNGETKVIVTESRAGISIACTVKVKTSPTSIKINKPDSKLVKIKQTLELKTTLTPKNANKEITWISSDKNIAEVDENGKVTGKNVGKVKITATIANGKKAEQELIIGVNNSYIDIENLVLGTFARNITTKNAGVMQNFAFEFNKEGNLSNVYISQESAKTSTSNEILNISRLTYDSSGTFTTKLTYKDRTRIEKLNHGDSLEYYNNKILTLYPYTTEYKDRKIYKIGYDENIIDTGSKKVKDINKEESIGLNYKNKKYTTVAVDEKNNIAVLRRGNSITHYYDIVKLDDLYNVDNSTADIESLKITTITHSAKDAMKEHLKTAGVYSEADEKEDKIEGQIDVIFNQKRDERGLLNTFQGVDIDGSYIYIYECFREDTLKDEDGNVIKDENGNSIPKSNIVRNHATFKENKFGDSYISIYDWSGKCIVYRYNVDKNLYKDADGKITNYVYKDIRDNKNYQSHEPEGIKVYNGKLYIGLTVKKSSTAYHNILYFK